MFESCPLELKEIIIKLLMADRFVDAKLLMEEWRSQSTSNYLNAWLASNAVSLFHEHMTDN